MVTGPHERKPKEKEGYGKLDQVVRCELVSINVSLARATFCSIVQ